MLISGKKGMLTDRDNAILLDLYFTRILSTKQIALLYFPSEAAAKKRLYLLANLKGVIEPITVESGLTVWTLTKPAFWRAAEFVYPDDRYRGFPEERFIPHMLDANDLYVALRKDLDRIFGEHPAWEWSDETRLIWLRSSGSNERSKRAKKNQPDAELTFAGNRYFIERQTIRSHASAKELDEKVDRYRRYFSRIEQPAGELEVIFACEKSHVKDNVLESAEKYDIDLSAGTVQQVADYLIEQAEEAAPAEVSQ